jgi:hypothetical protein
MGICMSPQRESRPNGQDSASVEFEEKKNRVILSIDPLPHVGILYSMDW